MAAADIFYMVFGIPEQYGLTPEGHCAHCDGNPIHAIFNLYGRFCGACCRWNYYTGPPAWFGDGMKVTQKESPG